MCSLGREACPGGVSTEDGFVGKVPGAGPSARAALAGIHPALSRLNFKITERLPPLLGGDISQTSPIVTLNFPSSPCSKCAVDKADVKFPPPPLG